MRPLLAFTETLTPNPVAQIVDPHPGIVVRHHRRTGPLSHRLSLHRLAIRQTLEAEHSLVQVVAPAVTSLLGYPSSITPSPAWTLPPGPTPQTMRPTNHQPNVFVTSLCLSDLANSKQTSARCFAPCQSVSITVSLTSTFASAFRVMLNSASFLTQEPH